MKTYFTNIIFCLFWVVILMMVPTSFEANAGCRVEVIPTSTDYTTSTTTFATTSTITSKSSSTKQPKGSTTTSALSDPRTRTAVHKTYSSIIRKYRKNSTTTSKKAVTTTTPKAVTTTTKKASTPSTYLNVIDVDEDKYNCKTVIEAFGSQFYNYKQNYSVWANIPYSEGTIAHSGCGTTSTAVLLTGYGLKVTPADTAKLMTELSYKNQFCVTSQQSICKALEFYGLKSELYLDSTITTENAIEKIKAAWKSGKPVIINIAPGEITSCGHYMVAYGETEEGIIFSEVANENRAHMKNDYIYPSNLEGYFNKNPFRALIIPTETPEEFIID